MATGVKKTIVKKTKKVIADLEIIATKDVELAGVVVVGTDIPLPSNYTSSKEPVPEVLVTKPEKKNTIAETGVYLLRSGKHIIIESINEKKNIAEDATGQVWDIRNGSFLLAQNSPGWDVVKYEEPLPPYDEYD